MAARSHFELLDADAIAAILAVIGAGTIPLSALAALTASRVVVSDGSGVLTVNAAGTSNRLAYWSGAGSLGVNAALTQNRVVTADSNGLPVSASAITADRALISNANGVPTHSTLTAAQLATALFAVTDTGRIDHTLSSGTLSSDLVAGGIRTVDLGNQQAGYVDAGNQGSISITSSSYQDVAAHGYTPRRSASRVIVIAFGIYVHVSGTTTVAIRRGTTVIGDENPYIFTAPFVLAAIDTGHGGSSTTWNLSAKNTASNGSVSFGKVILVDIA